MLALVSALIQVNEDLKTIGALAGFLAVPGLAVLSLLYFGQAREVRRLREWAGRAPERAAELEERVTADAQKRAQVGVTPPPVPAAQATTAAATAPPGNGVAKPAPAAPATAAAQAAGAAAATDGDKKDEKAADQPAEGQEAKPEEAAAKAAASEEKKPDEAKPGEAAAEKKPEPAKEPVAAAAGPPTTASPAATPAGAAAAATAAARARATAPPIPPRPAQPVRANVPSATVPPRSGAHRPGLGGSGGSGGSSRRSVSRGGLLGIAAAVLVLGIAAAIVLKVTGGSNTPTPARNTVAGSPAQRPASAGTTTAPSVSKAQLAQTNVAVLNGTTINGLARSVASRLQDQGYTVGNVTDAPNQAQPQTKVEYGTGHRDEARALATAIKVPASRVVALGPVDSTTAGPSAEVVVVVGQDSAH